MARVRHGGRGGIGRSAPRAAVPTLCLALALIALPVGVSDAWAATPNDPSLPLQWADSNTGQSIPTQNGAEELGPPQNGSPGLDTRAVSAWGVSTGSRAVVIGELDSGVQYTHPDLEANIWSNPGGVGGCEAGSHGFDALHSTCSPQDEDEKYGGHGTHVAGIMGAVGNNDAGVAGMNWQTTILPVKWVQSAATETGALLTAIHWLLRAREEGVNIRVVDDSLTFVGTTYSAEVKKAIEQLGEHNILFVTAAGNTGNNNDEESVRRYPCGYDLANEICVSAISNTGELPKWAGYGAHTVDLAAPGESIYSTLRNGYGYLSGGSMAAAEVSGAAALLLSVEPSASASELKSDILASVNALPALKGKVTTGGTLDVCRAMPGCEPLPTVTTPASSSITQTSAALTGTVNPNGREVGACRFEYGTSTDYGEHVQCAPMPGAGSEAIEVSGALGGLSPHTTYHYRLVASSAAGTSTSEDQSFTTPPEPPTVSALPPSPLTQTQATLHATVNPHGAELSECHFDYGTSTSYGTSAKCTPMPEGASGPVEVSAPIAGLSPNTTYHFRIIAANAGGGRGGGDHTFVTLPNPPAVSTLEASALTSSSGTLKASVNPHGGEVSDCHFDFGGSTAYGASAQCAPMPGGGTGAVAVSAPLSGLSASTTYHFRIVASNAGGTSVGSDQTFTTPPEPPTVSALPASPLTQTQATLHATVNPHGAELRECHFDYGTSTSYGTSANCTPMPEGASGPVEVSAPIAGLSPNTTYHFRIVASNAGGTSMGSDQAFATAVGAGGEGAPAAGPRLTTGGATSQATLPSTEPWQAFALPSLLRSFLSAGPSGIVRVPLSCPPGPASCAGEIVLRVRMPVRRLPGRALPPRPSSNAPALVWVASERFALAPQSSGAVTLTLSRTARALLARVHRLRARGIVIAQGAGGSTITRAWAVTVRLRRTSAGRRASAR